MESRRRTGVLECSKGACEGLGWVGLKGLPVKGKVAVSIEV